MIIAGNGIYEKCRDCGKLVKMNKWCGGLHFCLSPEQIATKRLYEAMVRQQMNYKPILTAEHKQVVYNRDGSIQKPVAAAEEIEHVALAVKRIFDLSCIEPVSGFTPEEIAKAAIAGMNQTSDNIGQLPPASIIRRDEDGEVDDVAISGDLFRMERMDDGVWWVCIYRGDKRTAFTLTAKCNNECVLSEDGIHCHDDRSEYPVGEIKE